MKVAKLILSSAVVFTALVSPASAGKLEIEPRPIREQYREVRFRLPEADVSCQLTLEGSFHARTFSKVADSLIGYITQARLGPCTAGTATILTLPWHIRYASFTGTLPEINQIDVNIINAAIRIRGTATCLVTSTAAEPIAATFPRNLLTGILSNPELSGAIRAGAECVSIRVRLASDRGTITQLGSTDFVFVRLI